MKPFALEIRNSADLETTLMYDDYLVSILRIPQDRQIDDLQVLVARVFDDLRQLDLRDLKSVDQYLQSTKGAIEKLRESGFQILALLSPGTWPATDVNPEENWKRMNYLVVPQEAFFKIRDD